MKDIGQLPKFQKPTAMLRSGIQKTTDAKQPSEPTLETERHWTKKPDLNEAKEGDTFVDNGRIFLIIGFQEFQKDQWSPVKRVGFAVEEIGRTN